MQNILKKENIYILILIFSFGFLLNWFLKSEIIITNSDDLKSLYRGFRSLNGGLSGFYETTLDLALKQGRGYFIYTDFFSHLPYLFHNEIIRSSFITLIYSLSGLTLYYIIYKFTKRLNICNAFLIVFYKCSGLWELVCLLSLASLLVYANHIIRCFLICLELFNGAE